MIENEKSILQQYVTDMNKYKLLTKEQEIEYANGMTKGAKELEDLLLDLPYTWVTIYNHWSGLLSEGKTSAKMSERYGSPDTNTGKLAELVDESIAQAMGLFSGYPSFQQVPIYVKNDIKSLFRAATLSRNFYDKLCIKCLKELSIGDKIKQDLEEARDKIQSNKDKLVNGNLRLVVAFARKFNSTIPMIDMIQEGNMGLIRAAEKYDPKKSRFSTYAAWWIRQAFIKAIKRDLSLVRLPAHVHDNISKTRRLAEEMTVDLGRTPTLQELADAIGEDPVNIQKIFALQKPAASLDTPRTDYDGNNFSSLKDIIRDEGATPDKLIDEDRLSYELIRAICNSLSKNEQELLFMRFGLNGYLPHTLEEIAEGLGRSRERVRQLESRAIAKLREKAPHLEHFQTGEQEV